MATTLPLLVDKVDATLAKIEAHLDALDPAARVREVRALSARGMERLHGIAGGAPPITPDYMVESLAGPDGTVRFCGKNSLYLFTTMEKRFRRHGGQVVGFNFQKMAWATGPGYFTCVPEVPGRPGEILFDYTRLPASPPAGWPPIGPNDRGLARAVFMNLNDYVRRVSKDVVVGLTTKLGEPVTMRMGKYFVMARYAER